jgi:protein involved in polysaccharide export with SLBB domain
MCEHDFTMKNLIALSLFAMMPVGAAEMQPAPQNQEQAVIVVGGYVRRPGPVPFKKEFTIYAAIQYAGGANEFGSMRRVKVVRDGKTLNFDLTKDEQKTALVMKNDTIEVPQKNLFGR